MSYKKPVLPVLDVQAGYERAASQYHTHHRHLNSFGKGVFKRMLPRSLRNSEILELGAGDGRVFAYMKDMGCKRYVAVDACEKLLQRHPGVSVVQKVQADITQPLPFDDNTFDLVLLFFVREHIPDLKHLCQEVARVLAPDGVWVFGHYLHRREFVFKDTNGDFKIKHYKWSFADIEEALDRAFLSYSFIDVKEKGVLLGKIYRCELIN